MNEFENNQQLQDLLQELTQSTPNYKKFTDYVNPSFEIISTMAYLIGVNKKEFENPNQTPQLEKFELLEKNKAARIVRNLSIIRTGIEKYYTPIRKTFQYEVKNLSNIPRYIPSEAVIQLMNDGVDIEKSKPDINEYLTKINREMTNRINTVKGLFPKWLDWEYIKELFIMPNGMRSEGQKAAFEEFNSDRNRYPYQCYINWKIVGNKGNILLNDEKFVTLLYEANEDTFDNLSLLRNVGNIVSGNLCDFINNGTNIIMIVDCENSDPVKIYAVLSSLSPESLKKINSIILIDGRFTSAAWKVLSRIPSLSIEHFMTDRIKEEKSLVDYMIVQRVCKEVYINHVDSILFASSDSDFWALIESLPEANFLLMVERGKTSYLLKQALIERKIAFCHIDDFYTGDTYELKITAINDCIQGKLDELVNFNLQVLLDCVLQETRVTMSYKERDQFYNRLLRSIHLSISQCGDVSVALNDN